MTIETGNGSAAETTRNCTGPRSAEGKAIVSQNATRHGFLSRRLFVGDEDPTEFHALFDDLSASLNPVGTLELALVEKIAVILWRQRRLVRAETAALTLQQQPLRIAKAMNSELLRSYNNEVRVEQLTQFDSDCERWCRAALEEFEMLETMDLATLRASAPHLYGQLVEDAEGEDLVRFTDKLEGGIASYLAELAQWCRAELREAEARPHLHAIADHLRARSLVLANDTLELFARYQTTLDSNLYKAMRGLRDTQEARLRSIEVKPIAETAGYPQKQRIVVEAD